MIWEVEINVPDRVGSYIERVLVDAPTKEEAAAIAEQKTNCTVAATYPAERQILRADPQYSDPDDYWRYGAKR